MQPPERQRPVVSNVICLPFIVSLLSLSASLRMLCHQVLLTFAEAFQLLGVLVVSVPFWREICHLSSLLATVWQEFRLSVLSDLGFFGRQ